LLPDQISGVGNHVLDVEQRLIDWLSDWINPLKSNVVGNGSGSGGSAFYTSDNRLVSQLTAEIHDRLDSLRNLTPVGGAGWSMSAETDFDDSDRVR
jgi:hypothetical protein